MTAIGPTNHCIIHDSYWPNQSLYHTWQLLDQQRSCNHKVLGMSKFLEFNTRVLRTDTPEYSSTRKTPQHSEEIYDPGLWLSLFRWLSVERKNEYQICFSTKHLTNIRPNRYNIFLLNPLMIWRKTNTKLCFSTKHLTNIRLQCNI
jgi:hypothetical protein